MCVWVHNSLRPKGGLCLLERKNYFLTKIIRQIYFEQIFPGKTKILYDRVDGCEIWIFTEVSLLFDRVFGYLTLCFQRADYACWKEITIFLQKLLG